jgi:hypothetical protein
MTAGRPKEAKARGVKQLRARAETFNWLENARIEYMAKTKKTISSIDFLALIVPAGIEKVLKE